MSLAHYQLTQHHECLPWCVVVVLLSILMTWPQLHRQLHYWYYFNALLPVRITSLLACSLWYIDVVVCFSCD